MIKEVRNKKNVDDFYGIKNSSFFYLLRTTRKWKELFNQKEAIISLIFSIVSLLVLRFVYNTEGINTFVIVIQNLLIGILSGFISLLGFIISGLAIFTGTITDKIVKKINNDKKIEHLIGILYSFYFIGAIIGITICLFVISYIMTYTKLEINNVILCSIVLILSYLFCFSILYSIALLGTCLRIFLLNYKYSDREDRIINKSEEYVEVKFIDGTVLFIDNNIENFMEWIKNKEISEYLYKVEVDKEMHVLYREKISRLIIKKK